MVLVEIHDACFGFAGECHMYVVDLTALGKDATSTLARAASCPWYGGSATFSKSLCSGYVTP